MKECKFRINKGFSSLVEFSEATSDELKVLLIIIDKAGYVDEEEISASLGVSSARVKSSIALWQSAGAISRDDGPRITEEFEERLRRGELYETEAKEIAKGIRDNDLADLFREIATMLGKAELTPMEVKRITNLSLQFELSSEYIATLAAYLSEDGALSVNKLVSRGISLSEKGVVSIGELSEYISESVKDKATFAEARKALDIVGRKLTPSEERYVKKWCYSFGFTPEILNLAYDFTMFNTEKRSYPYMDKILTDWSEAGCKSTDECRRRFEESKAERAKNFVGSKKATREAKRRTPRYGDFDPNEAFKRALERSYGNSSGDMDCED